jgi:hypothetical protein
MIKTAAALLGVLLLNGCVHLKTLNDFSSRSVTGLKKIDDLGYSFTISCNERCETVQLEKLQLLKTDCDCRPERSADSVTQAIYKAVKGYFEGLEKLSDNQLTNYKYTNLAKAIKEGDWGGVTINKSHVDAYAKISSVITRAVTDGYRKNKLSKYVAEANEPIRILLDALEFTMVSNLSKKLDVQTERMTGFYFDMVSDSSVSAYEKKKLIEEYNDMVTGNENRKKLIISYGKGLRSIAAGHQEIFENRNKFRRKELLELLSQYSSDIQDIIDEINTLK